MKAAVARGGFSGVYRARHLVFGEDVAIKCLLLQPDLTDRERQHFIRLFLTEGRSMYRLTRLTSSIVQPLNMGSATSPSGIWTPWLMLEWLEGRSLADELAGRAGDGRSGMGLEACAQLLGPVADGLGLAHAAGIVHRDVTPANIYLWTRGSKATSKLLDFGVAKVLRGPGARFATDSRVPRLFTQACAAPEQLSSAFGDVSPATDVYALALVVVWCVLGRCPYEGDDAAIVDQAIDPVWRPTLRTLGANTSDAVESVLQRALAVDSRVRYLSADVFWDALQEAVLQGS